MSEDKHERDVTIESSDQQEEYKQAYYISSSKCAHGETNFQTAFIRFSRYVGRGAPSLPNCLKN